MLLVGLALLPVREVIADDVRPLLAFTSGRDGDGYLGAYILHTDRSITRITPARMQALDPAWSPDGTRVAFSQCRSLKFCRIMEVTASRPHKFSVLVDRPDVYDHFPDYFPLP